MLYKDIEKFSASDVCYHIGIAIETEIKNQKLKKQSIAKRAGITPMSLYRLCKGKNSSLEVYIKVLKVINRIDVIEAMTSVLPASPLSYYDLIKKKHKEKHKERNIVTKDDIAELCKEDFQWNE